MLPARNVPRPLVLAGAFSVPPTDTLHTKGFPGMPPARNVPRSLALAGTGFQSRTCPESLSARSRSAWEGRRYTGACSAAEQNLPSA